jgi:membrane protein
MQIPALDGAPTPAVYTESDDEVDDVRLSGDGCWTIRRLPFQHVSDQTQRAPRAGAAANEIRRALSPDRGAGGLVQLLKASAKNFSNDKCGLRAAALCYYTVFAIPPLLILLIKLAGFIWSPDAVQQAMESQFSGLVGPDGARTVREMVSSGQQSGRGIVALVLGSTGLILGVTGAFLALQDALNAAWQVGPDPKQGGIRTFITKRLFSLGWVMGLGFLLVVSLAFTAVLSALGDVLGNSAVMQIVGLLLSVVLLSVMFAATFKFLPDAEVPWRSAWVGGIATAVLFEVGRFAIGFYLGRSHPGNAFGAASTLAVILVWIYYAGMILLFGAECTQQLAAARGYEIRPKKGAVKIER